MVAEPPIKRAVVFIDGQNLFRSAQEAFGCKYPNYDAMALARWVCLRNSWQLSQVRFYTGVPSQSDNAFWFHFWTAKLGALGHQGVVVFSRQLRYRKKIFKDATGAHHEILVGEEKGIDVRIALDVIRLTMAAAFDVGIIFSQDQDLSEVAEEIRAIARQQDRWIKLASAHPHSAKSRNSRGINKTDWIKIDRATYDSCVDPRDYRKKKKR